MPIREMYQEYRDALQDEQIKRDAWSTATKRLHNAAEALRDEIQRLLQSGFSEDEICRQGGFTRDEFSQISETVIVNSTIDRVSILREGMKTAQDDIDARTECIMNLTSSPSLSSQVQTLPINKVHRINEFFKLPIKHDEKIPYTEAIIKHGDIVRPPFKCPDAQERYDNVPNHIVPEPLLILYGNRIDLDYEPTTDTSLIINKIGIENVTLVSVDPIAVKQIIERGGRAYQDDCRHWSFRGERQHFTSLYINAEDVESITPMYIRGLFERHTCTTALIVLTNPFEKWGNTCEEIMNLHFGMPSLSLENLLKLDEYVAALEYRLHDLLKVEIVYRAEKQTGINTVMLKMTRK